MAIVIIGAGIGGLTTALSLHAAGLTDIAVYERADVLRPLGVGINLLPHAVRELTELGLGERIEKLGVAPGTLAYYNRFGQPIWSEPRGLAAGYRWPQLSVHRGYLQMELLAAVEERLGAGTVRTGHRLTSVETGDPACPAAPAGAELRLTGAEPRLTGTELPPTSAEPQLISTEARLTGTEARLTGTELRLTGTGTGAEAGPAVAAGVARFATAGGEVAVAGELIIGADGIQSALRRQWYPGEGEPVWNGLTLWRGTARMPGFLDGRTMIMAGDAEQKFVAYPIGSPDADGNSEINFIAERRAPGFAGANADWNRAVDPRPVIDLFRDWRFGWLDVPALLAAAGEILEYPMVDRDPVDRWTFGPATLLGDAAHPMYPNGSNGASQAILDARTLAFHLATAESAAEGLAAYEAARRPATTALVLSNRRQGPEQVMVLAHERAPRGFAHIHDVLTPDELTEIATGYKRAAGFHPDALNNRLSLTPPGAPA